MRRWTRSIAAKAPSIARCNSASPAPRAVMSTNVPRSGRARRTSLETNFISGENAAHALRDVPAGKGGAADVVDAVVQSKARAGRFADKLFAPVGIANFAAVAFAIIKDFDLFNAAFRQQRHCVIDDQMFADYIIDNKKAL